MMMKSTSCLQKFDSVLLIIFFFAGILLPLLDNLLHIDPGARLQENRPLVEKPVFTWTWSTIRNYPKEFERYFRDHLGFRNSLIRWYNYIHVKWLKISPLNQVLIGKDGWLYLGGANIDYYRGTLPLTRRKTARVARIIQERQTWLADRNIPLLYIFVPEKSTIYPEYIPDSINRVSDKTLLDHLTMYLREYSTVDFVDFRGMLLEAKKKDLLYQKSGTHWNCRGAYLGYRETIEHLSRNYPDLKPLGETDLVFQRETVKGFDLSVMLGLSHFFVEEQVLISPRNPRAKRMDNVALKEYYPTRPHYATEIPDPALPRAVMFRDSFADKMIPFLSEDFQRIAYIYQPIFNAGIILEEHPDLVMHQMAERSLMEEWILNPLEVSHHYLEDLFNSSSDVRFDMKEDKDLKSIKFPGKVLTRIAQGKMQAQFSTPDSQALLPIVAKDKTSLLILRIDINAPVKASLKLTTSNRYPTKQSRQKYFTDYITDKFRIKPPKPKYVVEEVSFEVELEAGRNTYYISIDTEDLTGPVGFHLAPGNVQFEIFNLEIRNVPYPHEQDQARS
jgi:alginate O-acetyltransferase complex protein AlgJ